MNFDDLKDQISERLQSLWDTIQESSIYINIRERYDNLSPSAQRLTLIGSGVFIAIFVFSIPLSSFLNSVESVGEFESRKRAIRDLLKVTRESKQGPNIPSPIPVTAAISRITSLLDRSGLTPEQKMGVQQVELTSKQIGADLPRDVKASGIQVALGTLNLRQLTDIGHSLQTINLNLKLVGIDIQPTRNKENYYDVKYKLAAFNFDQVKPVGTAETKPEPQRRRPRRRGS